MSEHLCACKWMDVLFSRLLLGGGGGGDGDSNGCDGRGGGDSDCCWEFLHANDSNVLNRASTRTILMRKDSVSSADPPDGTHRLPVNVNLPRSMWIQLNQLSTIGGSRLLPQQVQSDPPILIYSEGVSAHGDADRERRRLVGWAVGRSVGRFVIVIENAVCVGTSMYTHRRTQNTHMYVYLRVCMCVCVCGCWRRNFRPFVAHS